MGNGLRFTEAQLAEIQSRQGVRAARPMSAPHPVAAKPAQAPQTSMQRLQALGRLRDREMNGTEKRYNAELEARKMAGEVLWFAFEAIKLRLADRTSLTVDFFVLMANGELHAIDVKGAKSIVMDDSLCKLKCAAAGFPFRFFMAYPKKAKDGGGFTVEEV